MEQVFSNHPAPWAIQYNCSECGNGGAIHCIVDANGETILSSYADYGAWEEMWALYCVLTDEQKQKLGQPVYTWFIFYDGDIIYQEEFQGTLDNAIEKATKRRKTFESASASIVIKDKYGDIVYQYGKSTFEF